MIADGRYQDTAPELPSWDFLEDLGDGGSNPNFSLLPEIAKADLAKEKLKEKNRLAQKRARQRNKVFCQVLFPVSILRSGVGVIELPECCRQSPRPWHCNWMIPQLSCMN